MEINGTALVRSIAPSVTGPIAPSTFRPVKPIAVWSSFAARHGPDSIARSNTTRSSPLGSRYPATTFQNPSCSTPASWSWVASASSTPSGAYPCACALAQVAAVTPQFVSPPLSCSSRWNPWPSFSGRQTNPSDAAQFASIAQPPHQLLCRLNHSVAAAAPTSVASVQATAARLFTTRCQNSKLASCWACLKTAPQARPRYFLSLAMQILDQASESRAAPKGR